eukprot:jgi/Chrpa1/18976/Chrysochromulina_OHIO_Genome00000560-RA
MGGTSPIIVGALCDASDASDSMPSAPRRMSESASISKGVRLATASSAPKSWKSCDTSSVKALSWLSSPSALPHRLSS